MSKGNRIRERHKQEQEQLAELEKKGGKKKKFPWGKVILAIVLVVAVACGGIIHYRNVNAGLYDDSSYAYSNYDQFVKLGEYKDLEYTMDEVEITDEDIQDEIDSRLQAATKTEEVHEGVVEDGDVLNIDYEGKIDGVAFDGGTAQGASLTIGSGQFIDGFESGLIGKKIGDTVDLNLTFPKDYGKEELNGKDVVFTVTINSKTKSITPEYDEEFIKSDSDCTTKEEYENYLKERLTDKQNRSNLQAAGSELLEKAAENAEVVELPEAKVEQETSNLRQQYESMVSSYGMDLTTYLSYTGQTEEEFEKSLKESAEGSVKETMVAYAINKKEGVKFRKSEFKKFLRQLLEDSNMTEEEFQESYGVSIDDYAESYHMDRDYVKYLAGQKLVELGKQVEQTDDDAEEGEEGEAADVELEEEDAEDADE